MKRLKRNPREKDEGVPAFEGERDVLNQEPGDSCLTSYRVTRIRPVLYYLTTCHLLS